MSSSITKPPAVGPLSRLWLLLKGRLRPAPIATPDALRVFLEQRAALIAQKCAIDYVRGKTGSASYTLFAEKAFVDALEVCRWETFVVVLGDLVIIAEGYLRPHASASDRSGLYHALVGLYTTTLASLPVPRHRADGWDDVIAAFTSRFRAAGLAAPKQALDVADHSAKRLFDTLPIHIHYRELDEEPVYGSVRFRMVAVSQEMQRRFTPADLARRLLADQNVTL